MVNKNKQSHKITAKKVWFAVLYAALIIGSLSLAYLFWISAGISKCGLSGCSGGGFGIVYDPTATQHALIMSGLIAALAPLIIFFISKFKWWWLVIAAILLIVTPILGANQVGVDFQGNPTNTSRPTPGYIVE